MTKIVIGVFEDMESAEEARSQLQAKGIKNSDIDIRSGEKVTRQWGAESGADTGDGFWASIRHFFGGSGTSSSDDSSARGVAAVSVNDVVVTVHAANDALADQAADIMDDSGAVNLDERAGSTELEESELADDEDRTRTPAMPAGAGARATSTAGSQQQKIPVVEEQLKVGKREVSGGGVRVRSRIIERPVEEEVNLREEKVDVQRRPVDRPIGAGDEAFQEQSFEMRETSEEPVAEKRARVKEEVSVGKQTRQRTEKVRDTVRSTDVQIEALTPDEQREYATYENDFQSDWQAKYARSSGLQYQDVMPGYQYGFRIGRDPQYTGSDWSRIEPKVKSDWNERGLGPWERFKDAVRSGWERSHRD